MRRRAVVIFSGGPDSTAAALDAIDQGFDPLLLTFQFKGKAQYGELFSAMLVARDLGLDHEIIDFRSVMASFSPLMHILMHAGTPVAQSDHTQAHRSPFGAGMILAISANYAVYNGIETVIWGATKDDFAGGNPEYSQDFADKFSEVVRMGTGSRFSILVPFSGKHKHEVLSLFRGKESLFAMTWSCKEDGRIQSGVSKACVARRVAAKLAGLDDLTVYKAQDFVNPLSADMMANPESLTDKDFARIMGSDPVQPSR